MLIAGSLGFSCVAPVTIDHHAMVVTASTSPTMGIATSISDAFVYQIFFTALSWLSIVITDISTR